MMIRCVLTLLLICITSVLALGAQEAAATKPLNIVFIFTDDHACHAIGAYGSTINKTPNIDRIAARGVVFQNSFCGNSICGPSRATILTGKHSHKNGFYANGRKPFDGSQTTFPKLLQKAGYQTALIGKWHLASDPTGFDHWEILPGQGSYYNPDLISAAGKKKYDGYCTDIVTDLSLEWLKNRDKDKPFLLMCQHKAPHRNWMPPLSHLDHYKDVTIPEPSTLFDDYANRSSTLATNEMSLEKHFYYGWDAKINDPVPFATEWEASLKNHEYDRMDAEQKAAWDAAFKEENEAFLKNPPQGKALTSWKYQRYIKNYLRCIDSVDDNIGRVLGYLEQNNLMDNTVIVYSSDQGFYLGDHGWYDKRWMFEPSLKMPLIMAWPSVTKPNTTITKLIQNIDYAPTFLDIAGLETPEDMQGRSFKSVLTDPSATWRTGIYYHYYEDDVHGVPRHEGVRNERYKLINFYDHDGFNLFDLEKDPNEMKDLSKDAAYHGVLEDMKAELARLRTQYDLPPLPQKK